MNDQEPAVIVKDLHKTFKLPHDQHSGLKQLIVNFNKRTKGYELQNVLNGISFDIKKGEFFGIVGRNGSGKSTLLKLLAGIYTPDSGLVQVNGSLTPFIELGVGFNPELTGRENVFLNGALLGFSRKEMDAMYDDIVEFAELEKFMDQKLKNYSSGMQVRLAFSIAIRAQSDILLLDEVLAVGDEAFQRKCYSYFETLRRNKKTVILVTHDMGSVERFCTKAMLLEDGQIKTFGDPIIVARDYTISNDDSYTPENITSHISKKEVEKVSEVDIVITNSLDKITSKINYGEKLKIKLSWQTNRIKHASVTIIKQTGEPIFGTGTYQDDYDIGSTKNISFEVECNLYPGEYYIRVDLGREGEKDPAVTVENGPAFAVVNKASNVNWYGLTKLSHRWYR